MENSSKRIARTSRISASCNVRDEEGFLLVDLLVALVMATFVSMALYDGYAASLRASVAAQNQSTAATMVQECIDEARNETWPALQALAGTTQIMTVVGSQSAMATGRPLGMNTDLTFTAQGQGAVFKGTCQRVFAYTPGSTTSLVVTATVSWPVAGGAGIKSMTQSTIISQYGIHN